MENNKVDSSTCKLCGKKLSSFVEMQQHMTVEYAKRGHFHLIPLRWDALH
jgi:hypothetical protein